MGETDGSSGVVRLSVDSVKIDWHNGYCCPVSRVMRLPGRVNLVGHPKTEDQAWDAVATAIAVALAVGEEAEKERAKVDRVAKRLRDLYNQGRDWDVVAKELIELVQGLGD